MTEISEVIASKPKRGKLVEINVESENRINRAKELRKEELDDKSLEEIVNWAVLFAIENLENFTAYVNDQN